MAVLRSLFAEGAESLWVAKLPTLPYVVGRSQLWQDLVWPGQLTADG